MIAKQRLFLRGTFTAANETLGDQRIALGLNPHQGQLLEAEARVVQLASIINSTSMVPALLPWNAPDFEVVQQQNSFTVAEAGQWLPPDADRTSSR